MGTTGVRTAVDADAEAIAAIYNHEVAGGIATLDTEPVTAADRRAWLAARDPARHPVLVATRSGAVAGFAALNPWSPRRGYVGSAEVSVYVAPDARRGGVGRALLAALVAHAREAGLRVLLARIVSGIDGSHELHRALGFRRLCVMEAIGEKHGRLVDVELYDLHLDR